MPGATRFTVSGATVRTTRDMVSTDYTLQPTDFGVVLTSPNTTCFGMPFALYQQGKVYMVSNDSSGPVTFMPFSGEFIRLGGQSLSSLTIPSGESRQLVRETTQNNWSIV